MWWVAAVEWALSERAHRFPRERLDELIALIQERPCEGAGLLRGELLRRGVSELEIRGVAVTTLDAVLFDEPDDPWAVLGLDRGTEPAVARQRYRRLLRIFHPDRGFGPPKWCEDRTNTLLAAHRRIEAGDDAPRSLAAIAAAEADTKGRPGTRPFDPDVREPRLFDRLRQSLGSPEEFQVRFFAVAVSGVAIVLAVLYLAGQFERSIPPSTLAQRETSAFTAAPMATPPAGEPAACDRATLEPGRTCRSGEAATNPAGKADLARRSGAAATDPVGPAASCEETAIDPGRPCRSGAAATAVVASQAATDVVASQAATDPVGPGGPPTTDAEPPSDIIASRAASGGAAATDPVRPAAGCEETAIDSGRPCRSGAAATDVIASQAANNPVRPGGPPTTDRRPPGADAVPIAGAEAGRGTARADVSAETSSEKPPGVPAGSTGGDRRPTAGDLADGVAIVPAPNGPRAGGDRPRSDPCDRAGPLLADFQRLYGTNQLDRMLGLYAPNAVENESRGLPAIRALYGAFFDSTSQRELVIEARSRERVGQAGCLLRGQYTARFIDGSGRRRESTGPIAIEVATMDDGSERIARLDY